MSVAPDQLAWRETTYARSLPSFALNGRFTRSPRVTTNIAHLMAEKLEIEFPLPPLAQQHRIVAEVTRRLSVIEEPEAVVAANLQRATRLFQSILQQALTGHSGRVPAS